MKRQPVGWQWERIRKAGVGRKWYLFDEDHRRVWSSVPCNFLSKESYCAYCKFYFRILFTSDVQEFWIFAVHCWCHASLLFTLWNLSQPHVLYQTQRLRHFFLEFQTLHSTNTSSISISRPDIHSPLAMNSTSFLTSFVLTTLLLGLLPSSTAFTPSSLKLLKYPSAQTQQSGGIPTELFERISDKRREQLGIGEGEDEYDLGKALERNTVRNHRHQEQWFFSLRPVI